MIAAKPARLISSNAHALGDVISETPKIDDIATGVELGTRSIRLEPGRLQPIAKCRAKVSLAHKSKRSLHSL
jgi:hypothetical protein